MISKRQIMQIWCCYKLEYQPHKNILTQPFKFWLVYNFLDSFANLTFKYCCLAEGMKHMILVQYMGMMILYSRQMQQFSLTFILKYL